MNTSPYIKNLLAWINTHHCGVTPTGVLNTDGSITVRVGMSHGDEIEETVVRTIGEARAALGY